MTALDTALSGPREPTAPSRQAAATPVAADEARVRADLAALLQGNVTPLMLGTVATLVIAVLMLHEGAAPWVLWPWFALQVVNAGVNAWAGWRVGRRAATPRNAQRRLVAASRACLVSGLLWAVGVPVLWRPGNFEAQLLLMFLFTGLTASSLFSLNAWPPAFRSFFLPCVLAVIAAALSEASLRGTIVAGMVTIYGVTGWRFAARMHATLVESLRRRYEVEALAADLQLQKERAEEANLSKSRFLAAASHDLRQPVHALSLFVGALGQRPLDADAQRLVGHVRGAVDSMGSMFNALLDISRLDAGMVPAEPRGVALRPLLARIAADEGALAQDKGLALRLEAPDLAVRADPVLLERVLRNLVANAVRYTDRGQVLLAARRRGEWVQLRVADSGIGIPRERQAEVFHEFVQLHNPERERAQGMGLGLAIVRRLVDLMGVPLTLRSRPGRGSCFTLRLPLAEAAAALLPEAVGPEATPALPRGRGDLVLVVDDDVEIRSAMVELLRSWGWQVLAAGGMAELEPQLMALTLPPRLLVCDLRLRGDEDGLAVVERLQMLFNDELAAILVTGDTAAERLQRARASGHLVLHKPVSPELLQRAMTQALAATQRAD